MWKAFLDLSVKYLNKSFTEFLHAKIVSTVFTVNNLKWVRISEHFSTSEIISYCYYISCNVYNFFFNFSIFYSLLKIDFLAIIISLLSY